MNLLLVELFVACGAAVAVVASDPRAGDKAPPTIDKKADDRPSATIIPFRRHVK